MFFPITLKVFPIPLSRIVLYALVASLFILKLHRSKFRIPFSGNVPRFSFVFLISYVSLVQLKIRWPDFTILLNLFEIFILYPFAINSLVLIYYRTSKVGSFNNMLLNILIIILIQVFFMYFMLFFPKVKAFYNELIVFNAASNYYPFRQIGLTGFSAYNMGLFLNTFPFLCTIYLFNLRKIGFWKFLLVLIINFSVLFISLVTSRTGVLLLLFYPYFFWKISRFAKFRSVMQSISTYLKYSLLLLAAIIFLAFPYLPKVSGFYLWSFDVIFSLINGDIPSGVTVLKDQYWLPDFSTLLFGEGHYSEINGGYFGGTDGGYMRLILYFGSVGILLLFSTFWLYLNSGLKFLNFLAKEVSIFVKILVLILLIVLYKGNIIIDGNELIKLLIVLYFGLYYQSFRHSTSHC